MTKVRKRVVGPIAAILFSVAALAWTTSAAHAANPCSGTYSQYSGINCDYVGVGYVFQGDQVLFWQAMLYSHYGSGYGQASMDGYFDSWDTFSTYYWQQYKGITADGIVGPQTWSTARFWHINLDTPTGYAWIGSYADNYSGATIQFGVGVGTGWIFQPLGCYTWRWTSWPTVTTPTYC